MTGPAQIPLDAPTDTAARGPAKPESAADSLHPRDALFLVAWFALMTGLIEAGVLAIQRFLLGQFIWSSVHVFWIAPTAYLVIYAAPGLVLAAASWWRRHRRWLPAAVFVLASIGSGAIAAVVVQDRIHGLAISVLAAGIGIQAARAAAAQPHRFIGFVRRTTAPLIALVLLLAAGVSGGRILSERASLAALPPARSNAPNVVLLILDTVRAASLGLYGYGRPTTPNLERWAKRGVVFERAIAPAPWTLPSHGSMFTGRWPHEQSSDWLTPMDDRHSTLPAILRSQGYATAAFVANAYYCSWESGIDRGFLHVADYPLSFKQMLASASLGQILQTWRREGLFGLRRDNDGLFFRWFDRKNAATVNAEFLSWLERRDRRPFFAFLNYYDAHVPYESPREFRQRLQSADPAMAGYDAAIAYLDHELDRLFIELQRRGELDNTVVIVTSDHGEHFGEHGLRAHANSLYLPLLHVPLMLWGATAGIPADLRVPAPVSLRDLPNTVLELIGSSERVSGQSLTRTWTTPAQLDDATALPILSEVNAGIRTPPNEPVSRGPMSSLITADLHYIRNGDGAEELYAYIADPAEQQNLVGTPAGERALPWFRATLSRMVAANRRD